MKPGTGNFYWILAKAAFIATVIFFFATSESSYAQTCLSSSGSWVNNVLSQSGTGKFRVTYDATPSDPIVNAVGGLSSGNSQSYSSLAVAARFNPQGTIDARNGSSFTATTSVSYSAGVTYHFIFDVDVTTHTYSAYVVVGSVQITLGSNLAFRTEQSNVPFLDNVGLMASLGSLSVCNITLSPVGSTVASQLTASIRSFNFGRVAIGTSRNQNITLSNLGPSDITINNVLIAGAGFDASGGVAGLTLAPGHTTTVIASFAPSVTGTYAGSITVSKTSDSSLLVIALSGTGGLAGGHSVTLGWNGALGIGYHVYVGSISGGPYTRLTSSPQAATSYVDTAVQSGRTYYYVLTTVSSSNAESSYSSEVAADIP